MLKPVYVQALQDFRLLIRYADGVEGEVDLSSLAGTGVFKAWLKPGVFETVRIGTSGEIEWPTIGDLCPDALYMRITGREPEEIFPNLKAIRVSA